jgi:hypothetical protein
MGALNFEMQRSSNNVMGKKNLGVRSLLAALALTPLSLAFFFSSPAHATLGEPESSLQADGATLKGELHTSDQGLYRLSEIHAVTGTVVREYSTPAGNVFAVTWRGPTMPNLKQVLGSHYADYAAAAEGAPRVDRHHLAVRANDLIVHMSGHMRAFQGRAYLESQVPPGVLVRELP